MADKWTDDQRKAIYLRNRDILVSAAAGSGKTAVLVNRIISRILDKDNPVDIDKMLIVTFTNAAAGEMRERIRQAIEDALENDPMNMNLQKQSSLIHHAKITTIHSFCLFLIRNYFHHIDLEPNFRIAEEGELNLLKEDVLSELLDENYSQGEEQFYTFVESFATGKKDDALGEMILKLYQFANSYPWPPEFLEELEKPYEARDFKELEQKEWMKAAMAYLHLLIQGILKTAKENVQLTKMANGPDYAGEAAESDKEEIEKLLNISEYSKMASAINSVSFARLPSKKGYQGSEVKLELFKENRQNIKDTIKKIKSRFFFADFDVILERIRKMRPVMAELIRLTKSFMDKFDAKKREKNILDFGDLEHFALKILIREEDKELTEVAGECQNMFEEVMVDEYQDSNMIQEEILLAISKESLGEHNRFMVGDVKQSIYRFRLARPEIFMEKYDTYTKEDSSRQKIELHKNFRSRKEVLSFVNDIFSRIMKKDLGNVEYDEDAALCLGADYPEASNAHPELILADAGDELMEEADIENGILLEGEVIAARILKLKKEQQVWDKEAGKMRPIKYGDIVILLRSFGEYADTFLEVFAKKGIPAHAASKTGYFAAREIQTILNFLRMLDNPCQDIPLAAALRSPMGGFSDEELALIKTAGGKRRFYLCFLHPNKEKLPPELFEKIEKMKGQIKYFRDLVTQLPVHELLYRILEETGYLLYAMSMPQGERRGANIEMLLEKAVSYEKTSYRGLFHFIRYMDKLQKYQVDYGEADVVSENEDAVRIMTIHKSKGLEFPVVFVSGLGKKFNHQDARNTMVIHPTLGAALDFIDPVRRIKGISLYKKVAAGQIDLENQGEELRVLYVALTRAKEKLILTGVRKEIEAELEKLQVKKGIICATESTRAPEGMSFLERAKADCYLDWVLPVAAIYNVCPIQVWGVQELVLQEVEQQLDEAEGMNRLLQEREIVNEGADAFVREKLSYRYPFEIEINRKSKYSVSELKHRMIDMMKEEGDISEAIFPQEEIVPYIPAFIKGESAVNQGALRGSAMHRAAECLPVEILAGNPVIKEILNQEIDKILADGRLTEEMASLLRREKLIRFYQSDLAKRMKQAKLAGELYTERPFVMGKPADEVEGDGSDTMVLIQGIIDAFFVEEGEIVLLDYKTDVVDTPEELWERYKKQLELYQEALEGKFGKKVKEKLIYSFYFDQVIEG